MSAGGALQAVCAAQVRGGVAPGLVHVGTGVAVPPWEVRLPGDLAGDLPT
jgi:hypothetical protein